MRCLQPGAQFQPDFHSVPDEENGYVVLIISPDFIRDAGSFQQLCAYDAMLLHVLFHIFEIDIVQDPDLLPAGRVLLKKTWQRIS